MIFRSRILSSIENIKRFGGEIEHQNKRNINGEGDKIRAERKLNKLKNHIGCRQRNIQHEEHRIRHGPAFVSYLVSLGHHGETEQSRKYHSESIDYTSDMVDACGYQ